VWCSIQRNIASSSSSSTGDVSLADLRTELFADLCSPRTHAGQYCSKRMRGGFLAMFKGS
jgi:hypothetical protein